MLYARFEFSKFFRCMEVFFETWFCWSDFRAVGKHKTIMSNMPCWFILSTFWAFPELISQSICKCFMEFLGTWITWYGFGFEVFFFFSAETLRKYQNSENLRIVMRYCCNWALSVLVSDSFQHYPVVFRVKDCGILWLQHSSEIWTWWHFSIFCEFMIRSL